VSPTPRSTAPRTRLALALLTAAPAALWAPGAAAQEGAAPVSATPAGAAPADPSRAGALYQELARQDSVLFDAAFVTCDAARANAMLAQDVEFYHDQSGFHAGEQVRDDFRRLTANCPRGQGVARVLVPGSLRVYPINAYGAVQTGEHRFARRDGAPGAVARFVHLWRRQPDGQWRLTRVLSFDHQPEAPRAEAGRRPSR
jgi:ketosteroid isomerase-like protein